MQRVWEETVLLGALVLVAAMFALVSGFASPDPEPGPPTPPSEDREGEGMYRDGTFEAVSQGNERGYAQISLTLENDEIADIVLEGTTPAQENGEEVFDEIDRQVFVLKTEDYPHEPYHEAKEAVAGDILETQSPDVDTYTEATGSSNQWMQAVERAMENAETRK